MGLLGLARALSEQFLQGKHLYYYPILVISRIINPPSESYTGSSLEIYLIGGYLPSKQVGQITFRMFCDDLGPTLYTLTPSPAIPPSQP